MCIPTKEKLQFPLFLATVLTNTLVILTILILQCVHVRKYMYV